VQLHADAARGDGRARLVGQRPRTARHGGRRLVRAERRAHHDLNCGAPRPRGRTNGDDVTRRRWLLLGAAALVTVLVVVTGALFLGPLGRNSSSSAGPSPSAPQETAPPPWESTDLPGYDPDPGPFELTPLEETVGDPVTVSLSLEPDAVRTGGTVGLSFDATELANPMWDSEKSNLTLTL